MATHSSILAWEIPWTEEPGWLQSTGVLRAQGTDTLETVEGSPGSCRVWRVYDSPEHPSHIVRVLGHAGVSGFRCD